MTSVSSARSLASCPASPPRTLAQLSAEEVAQQLAAFTQDVCFVAQPIDHAEMDELSCLLLSEYIASVHSSASPQPPRPLLSATLPDSTVMFNPGQQTMRDRRIASLSDAFMLPPPESAVFSHVNDMVFDENVFDCEWDTCRTSFRSQHELCEHLQNDHLMLSQAPFHCMWRSCERHPQSEVLAASNAIAASSMSLVSTRAGPFRPFPKRNKLVMHVRTHTGERPFRCEECGRGFARADGLASHRKRHEKQAVQGHRRVNSGDSIKSHLNQRRLRGSREDEFNMITDSPASIAMVDHDDNDNDENAVTTVIGGVGVWACRICSRRFIALASARQHESEAHPEEVTRLDEQANLNDLMPIQDWIERALNGVHVPKSSMGPLLGNEASTVNPTPPGWDIAIPDAPVNSLTSSASYWALLAEQQFQDMIRHEVVIQSTNGDDMPTPASQKLGHLSTSWP